VRIASAVGRRPGRAEAAREIRGTEGVRGPRDEIELESTAPENVGDRRGHHVGLRRAGALGVVQDGLAAEQPAALTQHRLQLSPARARRRRGATRRAAADRAARKQLLRGRGPLQRAR